MEKNNIKPTYVTFEQAKLLLQKKYPQEPNKLREEYYNYKGELNGDVTDYIKAFVNKNIENVEKYKCISAPEQWKLVEWLRVKHGIWIAVTPVLVEKAASPIKFDYEIYYSDEIKYGDEVEIDYLPANTPQKAYSAAFDYILNNLI